MWYIATKYGIDEIIHEVELVWYEANSYEIRGPYKTYSDAQEDL